MDHIPNQITQKPLIKLSLIVITKGSNIKMKMLHYVIETSIQFSSVAQSCPTLCDPMDCSTPGLPVHHQLPELVAVYSDSFPLSWWCHSTISSSVVPFSSCPKSFPASGSFQMSQFFALGGQSIGVSASASVLPMNIQDWSPLGWIGWISLHPRASQESSPAPVQSFHSLTFSFPYSPALTSTHDHWKNHGFG